MDGWQRKSWNTHYFPDTRVADIASDELLFLHIQLHIRPLGRILEQTILRGALQEPTYQVSAQGELTMYLILYQQECAKVYDVVEYAKLHGFTLNIPGEAVTTFHLAENMASVLGLEASQDEAYQERLFKIRQMGRAAQYSRNQAENPIDFPYH